MDTEEIASRISEERCLLDLFARNYRVVHGEEMIRRLLRQYTTLDYADNELCCDFLGRHRFAPRVLVLAESKGGDATRARQQLGNSARHVINICGDRIDLRFIMYLRSEDPNWRGYKTVPVTKREGWDRGTKEFLRAEVAGENEAELVNAEPFYKTANGAQTGLKESQIEVVFPSGLMHETVEQKTGGEITEIREAATYIFDRQ